MNEKVELGNQQGMLMSVNCIMYYHGGKIGLLIKSANDITITNESNVDMNVISDIRTQVGVKWRLTRLSSLDFYYRFTYGYNRDVNITKMVCGR